jgi:SAM-dependent methyltransferase
MPYDPATYWSGVAEHIDARASGEGRELAGQEGPFHQYKRSVAIRRMSGLDVAGKTVFELGPGPGDNLRLLHDHGAARLIGYDIAPKMVKLARANLGDLAEINLLDGPKLPLPDCVSDVSLTVTVLQHNNDQSIDAIIKELTRVTSETLELLEDTSRRPRSYETYFLREPQVYVDLVTAQGFRVVNIEPLNVWVSEKTWLGKERLLRTVKRGALEEGRSMSSAEMVAEKAILALTTKLDGYVPAPTGLTAMRFERI